MSSGGVLVRRPLDAATIAHALRGARLGTHVVACPSVASTMDAAAALAAAGTPDGAVVLADVQTAGRGRHGRAWLAPPGTALMLSIVLRPPVPPDRLPQALMAVALGALEAIAGRLPADAPLGLKWPNDIVVGDRKIAGLLAETTWRGSDRPVVIVGLGLNVSQARAALPDGAVSLRLAGARDLARTALAIDVLRAADRHYADVLAGVDLVPRWSARLSTLGRSVMVRDAVSGAVVAEGQATGVGADGALEVTGADGGVVAVRAGDVTLAGG